MNEERKNPLLNSPHFNHKLLGFRPEFLQEFLVSLLETNKKLVENANKYSVIIFINKKTKSSKTLYSWFHNFRDIF